MKLDNLDTEILLGIIELKKASSTALAKRIFNPTSSYDMKTQDVKLRYRLNKLMRAELLLKNGTEYCVNAGRVSLTEAKLHLAIGAELPMGIMLVVIPRDGNVQMRQIFLDENNQKKGNRVLG